MSKNAPVTGILSRSPIAAVASSIEPMRGELFSVDRLEQLAVSLAESHIPVSDAGKVESLLVRLKRNRKILIDVYRKTADAARQGRSVSFAAEWILDNFHVIQDQLREAVEDLPKKYYAELPKLADGEFAGLPRVYALAVSLITHTDGHLEIEALTRFVRSYQTVAPLTIGELWTVPIALRLALVENLARLAARVDTARIEIEAADGLMDELIEGAAQGPDVVRKIIETRAGRRSTPSTTMFAAEILQRLRDQDPALDPAIEWLERRLASQGTNADEALRIERQTQSANQVSVGNAVTSMRTITATNWSDFFENLSAVEAILREDPSGDYAGMDFATRDRYRHVVERIAKRTRRGEPEVARLVLEAARDERVDDASDARRTHVGYYLVGAGAWVFERSLDFKPPFAERCRRVVYRRPTAAYLGSVVVITLGFLAATLIYVLGTGRAWPWLVVVSLLGLIPASDLAVSVVNFVATFLFPPRVLPKLDFSEGIPRSLRTIVVVPTLFSREEDVRETFDALEIRFLANQDAHVHFGVLSDFRDADSQTASSDGALVDAALACVRDLNARYGADRFFLFHRSRLHNEAEDVWMGWERKRGKLEEFNRLLLGDRRTSFIVVEGDVSLLPEIRFVITLDADTSLPRDAARRLVGTLAHPLNRPRFDEATRTVVEGYGILQPRISVSSEASRASRFSRIFADFRGVDPYTNAVSDVYQDLFGEASYVGKGIYDLVAFSRATEDRVPDNKLLSHDLFEGSYARTALVSDVELYDDFPSRYDVYTMRKHRWIRGDWQILPWLFRRVPSKHGRERNVLSVIARWKILDNLRRSLVAPTSLALLAAGWATLPGSPLFWTLAIVLVVAFPVYAHLALALMNTPRREMLAGYFRDVQQDVVMNTVRTVFALAFHAHQAWVTVDAIARVVWRSLVTHRNMLEWVSAAQAERRAGSSQVASAYRRMRSSLITSAVCAAWTSIQRPSALVVAAPFLVGWVVSPAIAAWCGRRTRRDERKPLSRSDEEFLRLHARKTWRFFERYLADEDNWLPPDNFQETPAPAIAHRTSPTNMGLALLAHVAARDLGYLGLLESTERVELTFGTMRKLERLRGHFLNWYDTRTLLPLHPRYVSTVDSGNLAGHLITLKQACLESVDQELFTDEVVSGIDDVAALLETEVARLANVPHWSGNQALRRLESELETLLAASRAAPTSLVEWVEYLDVVGRHAHVLAETAGEIGLERPPYETEDLRHWAEAIEAQLRSHRRDLYVLAPWVAVITRRPASVPPEMLDRLGTEAALRGLPSLGELASRASVLADAVASELARERSEDARVESWLERLSSTAVVGANASAECTARLRGLAEELGRTVDEMDFAFLFDDQRHLFSIGYSVEAARLDGSFYDLLASESRLGSFVAVAKGDVVAEHWHRLGRALTATQDYRALVSWSGSMFEYLMPSLVMRSYEGTLLEATNRAIVREQIEYAKARRVPWGISESAYNARDLQRNYQYGPFGVPGLGLKRGLAENLVVAPYATALALTVDPATATANLRRLEKEGFSGRFGYYESADYTPSRVPDRQRYALVRAYMAHHQGMIFLSLLETVSNGPMKRRFHREPVVQAHELLLQERNPRVAKAIETRDDETYDARLVREPTPDVARYFESTQLSTPRVHMLSNGSYSVMVTTAGGGYSRRGGTAISRWREDVTRDNWGQFCYVRDASSGKYWSTAYQPTLVAPESYTAIFSLDKAEFRRVDDDIATYATISVSTEDDAEVRTVRLINNGRRVRELDVTSYAEIVLASHAADVAHPAFSNLFVQTEFLQGPNALLVTRRRRSGSDPEHWATHVSAVEGVTVSATQFETDRSRFLGRGRTTAAPSAIAEDRPLSNTVGAVLDPIVSLRRRVRLGPGEEARVLFTTAYAENRGQAEALALKYADAGAAARTSDLAWTNAQVELRHLGVTPEEATVFLRLASRLIYVNPDLRARPDVIARNRRGQSGLWAYAISGDLPIVLVRVSEEEHLPLVRQLLRAHEFWRLRGFASDLVILNEHPTSYQQALQETLLAVVRASLSASQLDRPGGVFVRRADLMPDEDRTLLFTVARAVLVGGRGTLAQQIERKPREVELPRRLEPRRPTTLAGAPPRSLPDLEFANGIGGFADGGREYVIVLADGQHTPAPWTNVIANPRIGFLVTESGGGYTWSENSRENRLTPWSNDPVSDPISEAIYIRDDESGIYWTPTPLPARSRERYVVRHGQGYTTFEHTAYGIESKLTLFVPPEDPVKISLLRLRNHSRERRRLSIMSYAELVLGVLREGAAPFVVTEVDTSTGALLARNSYNNEFANRVAFADSTPGAASVTAERKEFLGRNGTPERPKALTRVGLAGQVGAGYDPCFAMQVVIDLEPGAETEVSFMLGEGADVTEVGVLIDRYRQPGAVAQALEATIARWDHALETLQVDTPDRALDVLVNRWLLYQTLCCRVWARAAFYQSGGAYGFRDQLQDVAAVVYAEPGVAREHILRAAARQFVEGDVQHWWHPPTGRGVRTRFSDDRLWLPFVALHYASVTSDYSVFDEEVGFIETRQLAPGEDETYLIPDQAPERASVFEHCVRAIEISLGVGLHGVPLMGSGDWNDGMNRVGREGRGESVWVGWFLTSTLRSFAELCTRRGDVDRAKRYRAKADAIVAAIEEHCWDGAWYLRAFFDDGTPLGSARNDECRIDSIAQSWGVIAAAADSHRSARAMASVEEYLVRRGDGLIMLFTPPFDTSSLDPGYIKGYVPGVRENGGQYTHAAIWVVLAYALLGDGDRAGELFALLNPVNHTATRAGVHRYKVEPYVCAADVYAVPPHTGRGGWTWYTGSASWMYRVAVESILGFARLGDRLKLDPCIPRGWPGFSMRYRHGTTVYTIEVSNPERVCRGVKSVELDGERLGEATLPLVDDGREHRVRVVLGSSSAT
jgi:cyclic beta-1,2-glucan synthetase